MNALIRKNADNVFAAYLQTAGSERIMELKPLKEIYALLSDKAKETAPGKILAERIADLEKVSIAATAPDFHPDHSRRKTSVALQREGETENYRFLGFLVRTVPHGKSQHGETLQ